MDRLRSGQPVSSAANFDAIAGEYDEALPAHVVEHYRRKRVAFILSHAARGRVLEVGCGTGQLAEDVSCEGYEVFGIDHSRGMLRQLGRRSRAIPPVLGDGTALPFGDGVFDLTYCVAVMHHVADEGAVRRTLGEMARVTCKGGQVLVWDHNPRNPYWPYLMKRVPQDTGDERLVPEDEIVAGLVAGGAEPVLRAQLGLVPDFVPRPLVAAMAAAERAVEALPGLRRLCAHNVVLAEKRQ